MSRSMRMYSDYFGIRENAFAITPDPRYLFMSERHREALAHLLFGTEEGGGFVQLTGEVGTGKTTICRAFLEQLPANVDVALLLSPPESARELLLGIASELRLPVKNREAQVRELVELLNRRLLEAHAAGRRTVVIIDEAQNIRSNVLEQVRLLTNLETPTHKLLQVFLIGQPELRQKLEHPDLRQVAQRITARYHLEPLSVPETRGYIRHRLAVAGCRQGLFTPAAIKQIYHQSQGIPRVINILCDRALMGAFATDSAEVTARIVRYAAREWRGETGKRKRLQRLLRPALAVGVAGLMLAAAAGFAGNTVMQPANGLAALAQEGIQRLADIISRVQPLFTVPESTEPAAPAGSLNQATAMASSPESQASSPATEEETTSPHKPGGVVAVATAFPELMRFAAATEADGTDGARRTIETATPIALQALLANWGIYADPPDRPALCDQVIGHGLRCLRERGNWNTLKAYNRPALLTLKAKAGSERYLALVGMLGDKVMVATTEGVRQLPSEQLEAYWNGEYVILWRPPLAGISLIGTGSAPWAVEWLQQALSHVDGKGQTGMQFDRTLEQRLRRFQHSHGLLADGIAGPRTLIQLNTLLGNGNFPILALAQSETR